MNNKKLTNITFEMNPISGRYNRVKGYDPNDELALLYLYFNSFVGYNPANFPLIKEDIISGRISYNDIGANIIDGKFQFFHDLIEFYETRISPDNLLELVQEWYKLIEAKVSKIMIIHDNGKFTLKSE